MSIEAGDCYLMDNGYVDFGRLFQQQDAFFVTHAKDNKVYKIFENREVDKQTALINEDSISLTGLLTSKRNADLLRFVVYEEFTQT